MVYLLLLMLGVVLIVHSYLLMTLMKSQKDMQIKLARLSRLKEQRRPLQKAVPPRKSK